MNRILTIEPDTAYGPDSDRTVMTLHLETLTPFRIRTDPEHPHTVTGFEGDDPRTNGMADLAPLHTLARIDWLTWSGEVYRSVPFPAINLP